jgi:coenzyme F420 hydrogenase subunit beta
MKVCPAQKIDLSRLYRDIWSGSYRTLHREALVQAGYGWASDDALHADSQSGGLVTALLGYLLDHHIIDRAVIARPCSNDPFKGEVAIVANKRDLQSSARSIYSQIPMDAVICKIIEIPGKTAFVGLPCQIQALRQAEMINAKLRSKIVLRLGLFCAGVYMNGMHDHLARIGNVKKHDVRYFRYRGHRYRGYPGDSEIEMADGRGFYVDRKYRQNVRKLYLPLRCFYCWDKMAAFADIAFGDPWGTNIEEKQGKVTAYIARSEQAVSLLEGAQESGYLDTRQTDHEWIFAGQRMDEVHRDLGARLRLARKLRLTAPQYQGFTPDRRVALTDWMDTLWMFFNTSCIGSMFWKLCAGRTAILACKVYAKVQYMVGRRYRALTLSELV